MDSEGVIAQVLALPEVSAWPEMAGKFERTVTRSIVYWALPLLACQSVGGDVSMAVPGAAAAACWVIGSMLVDDMLDEDPRGEYLRRGSGPTANLALAFQAAAFRVIAQAAVDADRRAVITTSLASMALTTALGQYWDAQNPDGEENCWRLVRAKTPFFGMALHMGALLGNASAKVAAGLRDFGALIGEIIQIRDDLFDAFQTPASPDWIQGRNSLPILYARTADHPGRARFVDLLSRINDPQALWEAQRILLDCGAVSHCTYHLVKRRQAARQLLDDLSLADPAPLVDLLARQMQLVVRLLQTSGAEMPVEPWEPWT